VSELLTSSLPVSPTIIFCVPKPYWWHDNLTYLKLFVFGISGDVNINYLQNSRNKSLLDCLLPSFNLHSAISFPTRISNSSSTAINNIFTDKIKKHRLLCYPYHQRIIRPRRPAYNLT
jgi:hypothetical protein